MASRLATISTLLVLLVVSSDFRPTLASQKTIWYREDIPIIVDYADRVITVRGKQIPICIDGDVAVEDPETKGVDAWTQLIFDRFDIFVDADFYTAQQSALDSFFAAFESRYLLLEDITGWSAERFYSTKLKIYVDQSGSSCWTGWALPGEAHVTLAPSFSNPLACRRFYSEAFNDTAAYFGNVYGNPGALGDRWYFVSGFLHEALHAINPLPILSRRWLTEGFSQYFEYNTLANFNGNGAPDISQAMADTWIYWGNANWHWVSFGYATPAYPDNDYRDNVTFQYEIQSSQGYDITAWMFSMMRSSFGVEDYEPASLDWETFYSILNNNLESLDRSRELGPYFTDTYVIDIFGRAAGLSFEETQAIWRYDGPLGPGWGVRNWESRDWLADLIPSVSVSCNSTDSIVCAVVVRNSGDTESRDAIVKIHAGGTLLAANTVIVPANDSVMFEMPVLSYPTSATWLRAVVDEDDLKVESNELNNRDSLDLSDPLTLDPDADGVCAGIDNCGAESNPDQSDSDSDGLGDVCDNCPAVANPNQQAVCGCYADPVCDGVRSDILDVVKTIEVAFRAVAGTFDSPCPRERTDVDASGATDIVDVVKVIEVAFRSVAPESRYQSPCEL